MSGQKKKVFVGLSGGVDSSVSAALLKKAGYDVTGVFIKVWSPDFLECSWKDDRLDAMRVAAHFRIPFKTLDLEEEYKRDVVDYMIREYKTGRTPNPDVFCNKHIKFGAFYKWALSHGADFVATGHYAQIMEHKTWNMEHRKSSDVSSFMLQVSRDLEKDQSYFLWQIRKEQLPHILFPVGGMKKTEVRKLAKKFGLITAKKKDSQGLCFLGKVDMKEFLSHYITPKKGAVLDRAGTIIGEHDGAFFFTIGQRHGFRIAKQSSDDAPRYVIAKNVAHNTITVAAKNLSGTFDSSTKEVLISDVNWLGDEPPHLSVIYAARVRYRQPLQRCRVESRESNFAIFFEEPQTAVAGQSLVLYDGETLLGGGTTQL
ncbi:MAG: tRNA-specific 2-thiouridylase [Parcubacteria group bacterium Gr01-1014_72]|nr:MAG: tRNA-specific 2-thiouridylase [Parcubacteria group bacterium Gr01-1014_72]